MPLPCLKPRRSSKVCPAPNSSNDVDLVEVRKGRMLRIQHINPRLRNKQVPQSKHGKTQAPAPQPLELHVPRVSFYGNKFIVKDNPSPNSNHVKHSGSGQSPNYNRTPTQVGGQNNNGGRCVKSNSFPSNLSKEQKRMLFKMGVRSVSALKNIVLFFFHGVGGSSDIWQTQINYFSSLGFEIVAPDLIGHGMSEVPLKKRAYHFREILADVIAIFDRYCKKKNLVIGHSYGCAFTTVLARERARRVWRLIMISGGGPIPLAPEIGIFAFPLWFVSCIRPCLDQVFEKSAFKKKQKNEMLKRSSFNIPSFVLHYVINGQDWPEGDEVYHSWISVPTLLINGREDTFATLDDAKLMKATIHGSKLEIVEEASHMVMLEAPAKVNQLILDFICSRGSHKLPDVKEAAEEGQESPRKPTPTCCYSTGGNNMSMHPPFHLHHHQHSQHQHQHQHPYQQARPRSSPDQSQREESVSPPRPRSAPSPYRPPVAAPVERQEYTEEGEIESYTSNHYIENMTMEQQDYLSTPAQQWLKNQMRGSSYDNASYESDESGEEYYYYKDQYGNHHYVSAKEYNRQFPRSQLPPVSYNANEIEAELSTVEIPAFEEISVGHSATDGNTTGGESTPDFSSPRSYSVEINATPPNLNSDGNPGYMSSLDTHHSDHHFESYEMSDASVSPAISREAYIRDFDENRAPRFSVPELQFCEECIRKKDNSEQVPNCERCMSINMAAAGYRDRQNSFTRRQSVTLALGRQRSDSLDYLGQEQLIIITCYDETEEEEISISPSLTEQQRNQRATFNNQRAGIQEGEETIHKRPSLPTLSEQEEEYTAHHNARARENKRDIEPVKKQNTLNENLVNDLHKELLAKVSKRNAASEERTVPKKVMDKKVPKPTPLLSGSSSEEGVISRTASFLESRKLMEAHFSKTTFKMQAGSPLPGLIQNTRSSPSARTSPSVGPQNKAPPKILTPKPERPKKSPAHLGRDESENSVVSSSPSFMQSKRAIHEHFSKVGLNSPMARPFSSPNLRGYGGGSSIGSISPQRDRKLSNSSPCALVKTQTRSEESLAPEPDDEDLTTRRLSVSDWAEQHAKRISGLASPGIPKGTPVKKDLLNRSTSRSMSSESMSSGSVCSGSGSSLSVSEWAERHAKRLALRTSSSPAKEDITSKCSAGGGQELSEEETRPNSSLSVNDWAARHLKLVASQKAPSSPVSETRTSDRETRQEMQKDDQNKSGAEVSKSATSVEDGTVSPKCFPGEHEAKNEEAETRSSLSLNEWANRHLKLVASGLSPPSISVQKNRTSPNKEAPIPKTLETAQKESGMSVRETMALSDDETVREEAGASPKPKTKALSLNEWAVNHVRKIDATNPRSPKSPQIRSPGAEFSPVCEYGSVRTPDRVAKPVEKFPTSPLNDWAEKHVRRVSEETLVSGSTKEKNGVERYNDNKTEGKTTSAIGQKCVSSTIQSDLNEPLQIHQSEDRSRDTEKKSREATNNNNSDITNDPTEEEKTKNNEGLGTPKTRTNQVKALKSPRREVRSPGKQMKTPEAKKSNISATIVEEKLDDNHGSNVRTPKKTHKTQEVKSSNQNSPSIRPSFSPIPDVRVTVSDTDSDLHIDSYHESSMSEDPPRNVRQQSRPQSPRHGQVSKDTDFAFLSNSPANMNNNNNNPDIPAGSPTFDNNSNVVASTSVSTREDNKDSRDESKISNEEQQPNLTLTPNPNQSAENAEGAIDNDNNRIVSVSTTETNTTTNASKVIVNTPHTIV